MKNNKLITFLGIMFILLWLSNIPYLFPLPFQPHQGIREFSKELADMPGFLKEEAGISGKTQTEIETIVARKFRILWIKSLVFTIIGIFSGILIVLKKNVGHFLALGLSLYLVGMRFYHFFGSEHWRERITFEYFLKFFRVRFQYSPLRTIHEEITFLILLCAIGLLLIPSIATKLGSNRFKKGKT